MSIQLIRFNGMNVTPKDDAILYEKALPINGIFYGCDLTFMGANKVHLAAGRGIYKGRDFTIEEQDLNVELSSSGEKLGRIYIRIDLKNAIEPISIRSITASTLPALIDDENFNTELGIGELELATYTAEELKINNLKETFTYVGKGLKDELDKLNEKLTGKVINIGTVSNQYVSVDTKNSNCFIKNGICMLHLYINKNTNAYSGWIEIANIPINTRFSETQEAIIEFGLTAFMAVRVTSVGKIYCIPRNEKSGLYIWNVVIPLK